MSTFSDEEVAKITYVIEECQLSRDQAVVRLVQSDWDVRAALEPRLHQAAGAGSGTSAAAGPPNAASVAADGINPRQQMPPKCSVIGCPRFQNLSTAYCCAWCGQEGRRGTHTHQTVRASRREGVVRFLRAGSSRPHEKAPRQCQASPARGRAKPGGRGGGSIGSLAIAFVMLMLVFCREAVTGIETDEIYIPFVRKMEQP